MKEAVFPRRYDFLDAARGFALVMMAVYHFCYDLVLYDRFPHAVFYHPFVSFLVFLFQCLFISMSGATSAFSRSCVKRGLRILGAAALVSLVTYVFSPAQFVRFGILHLLGVSSLLYAAFRPALDKVPAAVWGALFAASYIALNRTFPVPHLWIFGIRDIHFSSADYFPVFPWFFIYLAGTRFGRGVKEHKMPPWIYSFRAPLFAAAGRQALFIYLLHQPVLLVLARLTVWLMG